MSFVPTQVNCHASRITIRYDTRMYTTLMWKHTRCHALVLKVKSTYKTNMESRIKLTNLVYLPVMTIVHELQLK